MLDNIYKIFTTEEKNFFEEKINEAEKLINKNNLDLNYYVNIEKNLLKFINEKIPNESKKTHKKYLFQFLRIKFLKNRYDQRKIILENIYIDFYNFLNSIKSMNEINNLTNNKIIFNYSSTEEENNNLNDLILKLKNVHQIIFNCCIKSIIANMNNTINLLVLPNFILINEKKILKFKINNILIKNLNIPFNEIKFFSNKNYIFLKNIFRDFIDGKINVFDKKFFNKEIKFLIFKILILINKNFLKFKNIFNLFEENLKKFNVIIELESNEENLKKICEELINNNNNENNCEELINELDKKILFSEINKNNNLNFLILSLNILLNNLLEINNKNEINFASNLMCNSIERKLLLNLISFFDEFLYKKTKKEKICYKINFIIENFILSNLLKSYTKVLFDDNNHSKVKITFNRIFDLLINEKNNLFIENFQSFINNNLIIFNNSFDSIEYKRYNSSEEAQNEENNLISKIKNGVSLFSHKIISLDNFYEEINFKNLNFSFCDYFNISSHICICINGLFSEENSKIPIKNIFDNLIINKKNLDYYFYNWQNDTNFYKTNITKNTISFLSNFLFSKENKKEFKEINNENQNKMIKNNKKISKIFGKFLAYILSSRAIFKFHTISLIGFSLGCNVIKFCLKELKKLEKKGIKCKNILNNVVFIGGATIFQENEKHKEIFGLINGKIINFYSNFDDNLKDLFDKNCVGLRKMKIDNDNNNFNEYFPEIINVDLSEIKLEQNSYKTQMTNIIEILEDNFIN